MSLVLVGSTSGSVTLQEPAVAGTTVLTLPAVSGTVITTGSPQSGSIIQTVITTNTSFISTTSTTESDTGIQVQITPRFSTSKILIMAKGQINCSTNGSPISVVGKLNLTNSSNTAYTASPMYLGTQVLSASAGNRFFTGDLFTYVDSPASTSQQTYKIRFACDGASQTFQVAGNLFPTYLIAMEIAA
jgi:hypothetical protein